MMSRNVWNLYTGKWRQERGEGSGLRCVPKWKRLFKPNTRSGATNSWQTSMAFPNTRVKNDRLTRSLYRVVRREGEFPRPVIGRPHRHSCRFRLFPIKKFCDGKEECLFSIYLPEVRHLYIHKEISLAPVLLGAQPPRRRRVLSYLCVAEIYDPTNSNRNAAYPQHLCGT